MSLNEKIDNFTATMQLGDTYSSLRTEIVEDIKSLISSLTNTDTTNDKKAELIQLIWNVYKRLPESFFDNHSQDLMELIFEIPSQSVYKSFSDAKLELQSDYSDVNAIEIEPRSQDELFNLMLRLYLSKVSPKEMLIYLRGITDRKCKNLQKRLVFVEMFSYIVVRINKKEVFLSEMLPHILQLFNVTLRKYLKNKNSDEKEEEANNNIIHVLEYTVNYETWIIDISKRLLGDIGKVISAISGELKTNSLLLLVEDCYEPATNKYKGDKNLDKNRIIGHYCALFCLDLLSIIIENKKNLRKETYDQLTEETINILLSINPNLVLYINNYGSQFRSKQLVQEYSVHNKRDLQTHLQIVYHTLTSYNPISATYLAIDLVSKSSEAIILSAEYKLKLILPCMLSLFEVTSQNLDLKADIMSTLNTLLDTLITNNYYEEPVDNLNKFNIRLDRVIEKVLDYSGGPVEVKHRDIGLELFAKLKKLISEKALANMLLDMIKSTKNNSLSGHLVIEFKSGITQALRATGGGIEIKNTVSSFLNVNYLRTFFELGIDQGSGCYKDDYDLIGPCVNVLMLIYLKYSNLVKNVEGYMDLEFNDHCNVFRPGNLGIVLRYGENAVKLVKKINVDLEMYKKRIEEMEKETDNHENLHTYYAKFNEVLFMHDHLTRIEEIYNELNKKYPRERGSEL